MYAHLKDWENGWFGLELAASPDEIRALMNQLQGLLENPDQHFHISSDFHGQSGIGDIEVSVQGPDQPDHLFLSSLALAPGEVMEE